MTTARPLDTLPSGYDPTLVRSDLIATARDRYGEQAVDRALSSSSFLIVKRFAGMAPPPPPGAGPDWRAPTPSAMLIRDGERWLLATADGWRAADAVAAAEIDALIAGSQLWSESGHVPPCPDFGASNLLLRIPGKAETVRNAQCTSAAASLVEAALRS